MCIRDRKKGINTYYYMSLDNQYSIDARTHACSARFVNHSCEPNCQTIIWQVGGEKRAGIFALKDIKAGTELTYDYDFDYLKGATDKCVCYCGAPNCSGMIGVKKAADPKPGAAKKSVQKTGFDFFKAQYCKTADREELLEDSLADPTKSERAHKVAQTKKLTEQAKKKWEALNAKEREEYEAKAAQRKNVKPRKRRVMCPKAASEDDCFVCRDGGDLILCDLCPRAYHYKCLGYETLPSGAFKCRYHVCDAGTCPRKSNVHCEECATSFCVQHGPSGMSTERQSLCRECEQNPIQKVSLVGVAPTEGADANDTPDTTTDSATDTASEPGADTVTAMDLE
eukprot:TRINITY_DN14739_c0_g1_i1.p1 TRINITY_DN14739_c0_g1~~TRINITY_DN14739_c0_g1_i1.p1  ORF type:complete len:340 (-),score=63.09 TRINITY_DN14739_c0_g1_i1:167-1186(-)